MSPQAVQIWSAGIHPSFTTSGRFTFTGRARPPLQTCLHQLQPFNSLIGRVKLLTNHGGAGSAGASPSHKKTRQVDFSLEARLRRTSVFLKSNLHHSNRNCNLVSMMHSHTISFATFFGIGIGPNASTFPKTILTPTITAVSLLLIFAPTHNALQLNSSR